MNETVQQIKDQWDIVDEIKKVVALTKRGQNYVGLCPFHSEKTPSFYVSPTKRLFHCFGCGENGDVIAFVMKHDNLSFRDVIIEKATQFNIPHPFSSDQCKGDVSQLDQIRDVLNILQHQYAQWLASHEGIQSYIQLRGLSPTSVRTFGLGYSPDARTQITWLKSQCGIKQASQTGLFQSDGYPLLTNRLIIPIHNHRGGIIGFSGRVHGESDKAKYINSPESTIFSKKNCLYAMHHAIPAIKKQAYSVVVEGYTDVMAMHQQGIHHVVGVMGTALTKRHATVLAQYAPTTVLLFDSDQAGQAAVIKSLPTLLSAGLIVKIARIPSHDPADFFHHHPAEQMIQYLESAPHYMDVFIHDHSVDGGVNDTVKTSKAVTFLCQLLKHETNHIIKDQCIKTISDRFDVSVDVVIRYARADRSSAPALTTSMKPLSKFKKAEDGIAYFLVSDLAFRKRYLETVRDTLYFLDSDDVYQLFKESNDCDSILVDQISDLTLRNFLISLLVKFSDIVFSDKEKEAYVDVLEQKKITQRINDIRSLLGDKKNQDSHLLAELSSLVKKIK